MPDKEPVLKKILSKARYWTFNVSGSAARGYQLWTLKKLLSKAQNTDFGRAHDFDKMLESTDVYESFRSTVNSSDYTTMLPWWERSKEGHLDVTWPGKMEHFALSSGTSDGSSKYIPVSKDMVKAIQRASMRQVFAIAKTDVPKDHISKQCLLIAGSTSLNYNGIYYSGDLSGITTSRIPPLLERVSKPGPEIRSSSNWAEKIEKITREAPNWDVGMVAGVPAWLQILFKNIIKTYGLNNIHDIWPKLEVYIHGGVSIKPYKKSIDKLLGKPIKYFETYLASEGFIAFQTREDADGGMRLLLRNGIFFEFVPFDENHFDRDGKILDSAQALPIWEAKENVDYALMISTCSGAWRYLLGDTVRFINLKKKEIIITGRIKHFINLVGEHLSVDNINRAMEMTSKTLGTEFNEFAVAGIRQNGELGHRWYIGTSKSGLSSNEIERLLDKNLCTLNDDYAVERQQVLPELEVELLPADYFLEWMRLNEREGGQHKFPRVLRGDTFTSWQEFLHSKGVTRSESAY
jgi:GH3 auxin-responsive promoter